MYVNIINYKTRRQNIVMDVIMNLNYSFVIIKCKSYCKSLSYVKHAVLLCNGACSVTV